MSATREELGKRMEGFLRRRLAEDGSGERQSPGVARPSVTMSRQAGARGREIAEMLVDYLGQFDESAEHGWALFDQSLLARVIDSGEMSRFPWEVARQPPGAPGRPEVIDALYGVPPTQWTMFQHSADLVRRLCRLGNVIVLGRGANFITRDLPGAFHVRLVGDLEDRCRAVAAELGLSPREALACVESTDQARADYVRRHLNGCADDPAAYHLVVNTSRLDEASASRVIGDSLLDWACSCRPGSAR